jgi:hypothetical protein
MLLIHGCWHQNSVGCHRCHFRLCLIISTARISVVAGPVLGLLSFYWLCCALLVNLKERFSQGSGIINDVNVTYNTTSSGVLSQTTEEYL